MCNIVTLSVINIGYVGYSIVNCCGILNICYLEILNVRPNCQGRGNKASEIPRTWQGATEGTGGVFSQQKYVTAFHSTMRGRRYSMIFPLHPERDREALHDFASPNIHHNLGKRCLNMTIVPRSVVFIIMPRTPPKIVLRKPINVPQSEAIPIKTFA